MIQWRISLWSTTTKLQKVDEMKKKKKEREKEKKKACRKKVTNI